MQMTGKTDIAPCKWGIPARHIFLGVYIISKLLNFLRQLRVQHAQAVWSML